MVVARSNAEMPVLVPCRASTETVNAVRFDSVFTGTISGRSSSSRRSPVIGTQMTPEVCWRKNAIFSGVAASAAMMRSPSFSRASSSVTTTISPRPMAAIASSIRANGITRSSVCKSRSTYLATTSTSRLTRSPRPLRAERGDGHGVGDDGHGEPVVERLHDGEAASVDGDRALLHDVAEQLGRHPHAEIGRGLHDLAHRVDVTLHEMAAEPVGQPHRALEVHRVAGPQVVEVRARERLVDRVRLPPARADLGDGHATTVDGDRVADLRVLTRERGGEAERARRRAPRTRPSSSTIPVNTVRAAPP